MIGKANVRRIVKWIVWFKSLKSRDESKYNLIFLKIPLHSNKRKLNGVHNIYE